MDSEKKKVYTAVVLAYGVPIGILVILGFAIVGLVKML